MLPNPRLFVWMGATFSWGNLPRRRSLGVRHVEGYSWESFARLAFVVFSISIFFSVKFFLPHLMFRFTQSPCRSNSLARSLFAFCLLISCSTSFSFWLTTPEVFPICSTCTHGTLPVFSIILYLLATSHQFAPFVHQFWKKRKQWSTSPTITWSPWQWSFSKHTKWWTRERIEYWPEFSFILVLSSLLFVFSLLWIGKYLKDRE